MGTAGYKYAGPTGLKTIVDFTSAHPTNGTDAWILCQVHCLPGSVYGGVRFKVARELDGGGGFRIAGNPTRPTAVPGSKLPVADRS